MSSPFEDAPWRNNIFGKPIVPQRVPGAIGTWVNSADHFNAIGHAEEEILRLRQVILRRALAPETES